MKKIISILVIATLFVACGNKVVAPVVTGADSVKVVVDSVDPLSHKQIDPVKPGRLPKDTIQKVNYSSIK
jgi:hypothetical protein